MAHFYERALGLRRYRTHHDSSGALRSIWLAMAEDGPGAGVLMIERTEDCATFSAAPAVAGQGVERGWFLLAFSVATSERTQLERRIESAGSRIEHRTEHSSYARDPEGNRFAISDFPL